MADQGWATTDFSTWPTLYAGSNDAGVTTFRSLLKFNTANLPTGDVQVLAANVWLYNSWSASCNQRQVHVNGLTSSLAAGTTWANKPGVATTNQPGAPAFAHGATGCLGSQVVFDIGPLAQTWANGAPNHGVQLSAGDENLSDNFRVFHSAEAGIPSAIPTLVLTYNSRPAMPTAAAPAHQAVLPTLTPTLTLAAAAIPDPDPEDVVSYFIRVTDSPDAETGAKVAESANFGDELSFDVPPGALLDGVTYWWHGYASDGKAYAHTTWANSFRVDLGLGRDGTAPVDDAGPASVNLANGNLMVGHASPTLDTVGGGVGASFAYNSSDPALARPVAPSGIAYGPYGLTGEYFDNTGGSYPPSLAGKTPVMVRRDTSVNFDWGSFSGPPGLRADDFMIRWTGWFVPPATGSYKFGAAGSDGVRIWINHAPVLDDWNDQVDMVGSWSPNGVSLTAGVKVPIRMDYYERTGPALIDLLVSGPVGANGAPGSAIVGPGYLAAEEPAVPVGWALSVGGASATVSLRAAAGSATLTDASGDTATWAATASGWTPPAGSDATLARDGAGAHSIDDGGLQRVYDPTGRLISLASASDALAPASAALSYSVSPTRLRTITDPVSGRFSSLRYGGEAPCPPVPAVGFAAAPAGMLCAIDYWDYTRTLVHYDPSGRVARIDEAGPLRTDGTRELVRSDFAYDANGRMTNLRSPLNHDAIGAGVAANDASSATAVTYNSVGKVSTLTAPVPAALVARPAHSYRYVASDPMSLAGETQLDVAGLTQPHGFARKVTFDGARRTLADTDATNATTGATWEGEVWEGSGRLISSTDPAGRTTEIDYDHAGRPVKVWGPYPGAPAACQNNVGGSNGVCPVSYTTYDAGMVGLAASYWPNATRSGRPKVHATGVGGTGGALSADWSAAPPAGLSAPWSARFSGEITIPTARRLKVIGGTATMWVDDVKVTDASEIAICPPGQTVACRHRIQIDYTPSPTATIALHWAPEATGGSFTPVLGEHLAPRYGLVTRTEVEDRTTGSPPVITATAYGGANNPDPAYGRVASVTNDPGASPHANLVTSNTYEAGGFLRPTSRALPAGNRTGYAYYGDNEPRTNPCPNGTAANQAGRPKLTSAPSPDGGTTAAWTFEVVYDEAGRVVASRRNADPWTCTVYDERRRVKSVAVPALVAPYPYPTLARTVTATYPAPGADPRTSSVADPAGTIATTVDLLGRPVSYTDVWGNRTTSAYNQPGRLTDTVAHTGVGGLVTSTRHTDHDPAGRPVVQKLDGVTLATACYHGAGELAQVAYDANGTKLAGAGPACNGVAAGVTRDPAGRTTGLRFAQAGAAGLLTSDTVTRSQAGRVMTTTVDGAATPAASYTYDTPGRLAEAVVPGHSLVYAFDASGNCGLAPAAGMNTNRTSVIDNGGTPTTYCYNQADQLTSSSDAGVGNPAYDPHGNTRTMGTQSLGFDGSDRHISTTTGTTSVSYLRDATDRIVSRTEAGTTVHYGYSGGGDSSAFTTDAANLGFIDRTVGLIGGVMVTKRGSGDVWSYPNIHGDVVATADPAGAKRGDTVAFDPFGTALSPTSTTAPDGLADNSAGNFDYGWLGQHQRGLEHAPGITTIEMGARPYVPGMGRFLGVDPVEGGSANDYDYCTGDPVNCDDLDGEKPELILAREFGPRTRATIRVVNRKDKDRDRGYVRVDFELAPRGALNRRLTVWGDARICRANGECGYKPVSPYDPRAQSTAHASIGAAPGEVLTVSGCWYGVGPGGKECWVGYAVVPDPDVYPLR